MKKLFVCNMANISVQTPHNVTSDYESTSVCENVICRLRQTRCPGILENTHITAMVSTVKLCTQTEYGNMLSNAVHTSANDYYYCCCCCYYYAVSQKKFPAKRCMLNDFIKRLKQTFSLSCCRSSLFQMHQSRSTCFSSIV